MKRLGKGTRVLLFVSYFVVSVCHLYFTDVSLLYAIFQAVSVACSYIILLPLWLETQKVAKFLDGFLTNRRGA